MMVEQEGTQTEIHQLQVAAAVVVQAKSEQMQRVDKVVLEEMGFHHQLTAHLLFTPEAVAAEIEAPVLVVLAVLVEAAMVQAIPTVNLAQQILVVVVELAGGNLLNITAELEAPGLSLSVTQ